MILIAVWVMAALAISSLPKVVLVVAGVVALVVGGIVWMAVNRPYWGEPY